MKFQKRLIIRSQVKMFGKFCLPSVEFIGEFEFDCLLVDDFLSNLLIWFMSLLSTRGGLTAAP